MRQGCLPSDPAAECCQCRRRPLSHLPGQICTAPACPTCALFRPHALQSWACRPAPLSFAALTHPNATHALTSSLCDLSLWPQPQACCCTAAQLSAHTCTTPVVASQLRALHTLIPIACAHLRLLRSASPAQSAGRVAAATPPGGHTGPLPAAPPAPTAGQPPQMRTACKALGHIGAGTFGTAQQGGQAGHLQQGTACRVMWRRICFAPCCPSSRPAAPDMCLAAGETGSN